MVIKKEMQEQFILVLDIGKTNIKVHVLDSKQNSVAVNTKKNTVIDGGLYPHFDIEGIWTWVLNVFTKASNEYDIKSIVVTTHGATAVLIDKQNEHGLAMPVLDYEYMGVESINDEYEKIRPDFYESYSPSVPGGLNIGRQIYWQQEKFPEQFSKTEAILMYPQYWVWRLTGEMVSECTSLGCHTDLWDPKNKAFTDMVVQQGWQDLFPSLVNAWDVVGNISSELSQLTGISKECVVHAGVHDSNASFLRFIPGFGEREFCVMSTGTWVIGMASGSDLKTLDDDKDMLANVDVNGNAIPCIRFMGGREYSEICSLTQAEQGKEVECNDVEKLIQSGVFALPNFSSGSGPFGRKEPRIIGDCNDGNALAALYCALMMSYCIDLLEAKGDVIIVGSYLQNPLICKILAQLRGQQAVLLARDTGGTVRGAALLTCWGSTPEVSLALCEPSKVQGLKEYADEWLRLSVA